MQIYQANFRDIYGDCKNVCTEKHAAICRKKVLYEILIFFAVVIVWRHESWIIYVKSLRFQNWLVLKISRLATHDARMRTTTPRYTHR